MNNSSITLSDALSQEQFFFVESEVNPDQLEISTQEPMYFETHFEGCMEMYSDAQTVAQYLNAHEGWFCRCAQPMKVEPINENGYTLIVGRFGSFGYEVEPKISVVLQPPQDGIYYMHTIPLEDNQPSCYNVDYNASMRLLEIPTEAAESNIVSVFRKHKKENIPTVITKVTWDLHLKIAVHFPKFIYKLPSSLIQSTGDRVLTEIIRQISPRLTQKVQQDFHTGLDLPLPPKDGRKFQRIGNS
jgi:Protein of unknown function (DUF1997)